MASIRSHGRGHDLDVYGHYPENRYDDHRFRPADSFLYPGSIVYFLSPYQLWPLSDLMAAVMILMFTVIIPKIATMITDSGQPIPSYTQVVLYISYLLINYGLYPISWPRS